MDAATIYAVLFIAQIAVFQYHTQPSPWYVSTMYGTHRPPLLVDAATGEPLAGATYASVSPIVRDRVSP